MKAMEIRADDPRNPPVAALLAEHLGDLVRHSPPESMHALDADALGAPGVTLWTAWEGETLLGCGALLELDRTHAEIKSMRTATRHLRKGVAAGLLAYMIEQARQRGYRRLSLETGSMDAFAPSRALYAGYGFVPCEPFAGYVPDPHSVFMTHEL